VPGKPCRFAIFGSVRGHRGILAGAQDRAGTIASRIDAVRVGISLLTLVPGEQGGAETYARELVRALARVGTHEYTAFVPEAARDAAEGLEAITVRGSRIARRGPPRIPAVALTARLSSELRSRLRQLDVIHYPLTVPVPRGRASSVVTLQDLQHHDLPELFSRSRRLFRRRAYDRAARRADAVVVPSEFVRSRALALLGLDHERVRVVPHGVDHGMFRPGDEARELFLLYPARPWKHKNHLLLLQAFTDLRREVPGLRLALTGDGLDGLQPLPEGVDLLGYVPRQELASLYRRAACVVFPSLYEGFGLPVLEAMASGCPVAASNRGAIPEVCGDAAVLFDPEDVYAITNGVRDALARADELRERGIARAAGFTWEETARRHEVVYRAVVSEGRGGSSTTQ
jgi:glycosyltransferase involved in cell wall biosynthesis